MLKNTFVSELDKYITTYGSILHFDNVKESNEENLTTHCNKLNFSIKKDSYKGEIELKLANVSIESTVQTTSNFGILCTEKD